MTASNLAIATPEQATRPATTIHPTQDLLILRKLPDEDQPTTSWGLLLPPDDQAYQQTPLRGVVLFAGAGRIPKLAPVGIALVQAVEALCGAVGSLLAEVESKFPVERRSGIGIATVRGYYDQAVEALAEHSTLPMQRQPMQIKVGDTVIYSRHGYQEFRLDGLDLVVLQEASCLGILSTV